MSEFSDRPFVAGSVTGVRSFRVTSSGDLTGVYHMLTWEPGLNTAVCQICALAYKDGYVPDFHQIAGVHCSCGFYAYFDYAYSDYRTYPDCVVGLVRGQGVTTIGSRGFRCEKAEIVALVEPDNVKPKRFDGRVGDDLADRMYKLGGLWFALSAFLLPVSLALVTTATVRLGAWWSALYLVSAAAAILLYLSLRSITVHFARLPDLWNIWNESSVTPTVWARVREKYDVPTFGTLSEALAAYPLTPEPQPSPAIDTDTDIPARRAS